MSRELTYLACPYSHDYESVRQERFDQVTEAAAALMQAGKIIYSPITHCHPIAQYGLPLGWDFWEAADRAFLNASYELIALKLDGWQDSGGMKAEIGIAKELGIPVYYKTLDSLLNR